MDGTDNRVWHSNYGGSYSLSGDGTTIVVAGLVNAANGRRALVLHTQMVSDAFGATRRQLTHY